MATSQNGWTVYDDYGAAGLVGNPPVPGAGVRIMGGLDSRAAPLLLEVARLWHTTVEPLRQDWGQWGYQKREIRGSTTGYSNHASGTAIDLNASKHPLGTSPAATLTAAQIVACRRIVARWPGVIRWGGDYTGRKDSMHWEIIGTPAAVKRAVDKINHQEEDMPLNADDMKKIREAVKDEVRTQLLNTPIAGTKNYTIPIALKELLIRAGAIKPSK